MAMVSLARYTLKMKSRSASISESSYCSPGAIFALYRKMVLA